MTAMRTATWQGDPQVLPVGVLVEVLATHGTSAWVRWVRGEDEAPRYRSCELSDLNALCDVGILVTDDADVAQNITAGMVIPGVEATFYGSYHFDPPISIPRDKKALVDMRTGEVTFQTDERSVA